MLCKQAMKNIKDMAKGLTEEEIEFFLKFIPTRCLWNEAERRLVKSMQLEKRLLDVFDAANEEE